LPAAAHDANVERGGTRPVAVDHASVAVRASGADAVPGTLRGLIFHGRRAVTIPAGERRFGDPVPLEVPRCRPCW
jgi:hypothetical protein